MHDLLAENGLTQFYDLSRHPGVKVRQAGKLEKWTYLDDPGLHRLVEALVDAEDAILVQQLSEQFSFALVDIEFGRYEIARQRLEFIIQKDPNFPGAQEKLTEVLVKMNVPTPTATVPPTTTPDFSGAENAYLRAQELIRAQDWNGALTALDTVRKLDPNYKAAQVDGMYYFAFRNYGYDLIINEGNLGLLEAAGFRVIESVDTNCHEKH